MRLAKFIGTHGTPAVGLVRDNEVVQFSSHEVNSLFDILNAESPIQVVESLLPHAEQTLSLDQVVWLPPIDQQEVWAAGVTYKRSQTARMEESEAAADCYDRVYQSDRPELFFKATPHRVTGTGQTLRIRKDSKWNVPEPEFAMALNSRGQIVGFTIGNDMSSRDIEGENPLYLPQAKVYDQCCGLGPWVVLASEYWKDFPQLSDVQVRLEIVRGGEEVFSGETSLDQLARSLEGLVEYLFRDQHFPRGVFLLTGTGIVPDNDFTLLPQDIVNITISGIGTLTSEIIQG
ncbi:fumarylacetoacetate hydrolase family protein [Blastopirellula marina]|uniref:2-hydroxyhepta-2,4-diene-1,7-dioate isomerase n=1 Tax=Blastopirellula marina TaxID=124 RepID=A0A2S8FNK4_9BACT|nr:fumarylacetoacetate hydrolase family protein [Blastopirellula marina]PQO33737.1 2-hydroxyhepta-2,4-diene-1,7-dioate isomerase [Blastopirellula marina]PTL43524.1 2-hydroxyhepta-2,4-diene-1,7-dioate isomerase [Blastopirellula marina]